MLKWIKYWFEFFVKNIKAILTICTLIGITNLGTAYTVKTVYISATPIAVDCGATPEALCRGKTGIPIFSKWDGSLSDCIFKE